MIPTASFSWALCFLEYIAAGRLGVLLEQRALDERRPKMRRWLGAGCAVALISACISPRAALAQTTSATSKPATAKAKPATTSTRKHAKSGAASTSATKAHSTSHAASGTHSKSSTVVAHNSKSRRTASGKGSKRKTARGQQKIDSERAQAIQEALIREHYLSGEATGTWNQSSEEAMRRYQADHGWQSKTVPDSRALISLGLGPSHDHLLNPESAMVTGPFPTRSAGLTPVSHSASPGAQGNTPAANAPVPAQNSDHDASGPQ
jgi:hypothetical protein